MLVQLGFCGVIYVSLVGAQFTYPSLSIDFRYSIPIDTCIQNVSKPSNYVGGQGGSMICRCNEQKKATESTVMCHWYDEIDCTGELQDEEIWGGCVNEQYLYTVENCSWAQEVAETDNGCKYWVKGTSSSDLNQVVTPLYQCMDYNCNGDNDEEESQSCLYACASSDTEVQEQLFSNYECAGNPEINTETFVERQCGDRNGPGCGARVTRYNIGSGSYSCGSKKSPFKTESSNDNVKYFMKNNEEVPIPIGSCFEVRNGFYSYSYKYECMSDQDIDTVMKKVYLGSSSCNGNDYHIAQNYSSLNHTVSCSGSNGKGAYGEYAPCSYDNWDAYYADTPMLFGRCVPFMLDPDTKSVDDNGRIADRPWNQNLRVVFSCNLKKRYLSAYFYVDENCDGDHLFYWDWDNDFSKTYSYGSRACGRPKIQNCGNSADTAGNRIGQQL